MDLVSFSFFHSLRLPKSWFLIGKMKMSAYPHPTKMVLKIRGSNFKFLIMIHKKLIRKITYRRGKRYWGTKWE